MMRNRWMAASMALLLAAAPVRAQDAQSATMALPLARQVAARTIELVETRAVYPRRQADYDAAKDALLAALDAGGSEIGRSALFMRLSALLGTLDADGHSFIVPARDRQPVAGQLQPVAATVAGSVRPPSLRLVTRGQGTVLRWTPPAILGDSAAGAAYLKRFIDEARASADIREACALVIDLSEQTGGNAWPPFIAMRALFGDANQAAEVDRDGKRKRLVNRTGLEEMALRYVGEQPDPLAPFAGQPLAVVVGDHTSSAGEMLLVALLGEARVQTFGRPSGGLSTSNAMYALPDGSTLMLTQSRYAQGDGPVYQGRIAPMHPAPDGTSIDATVRTAAEWAVANSPRCKAPAIAARQ